MNRFKRMVCIVLSGFMLVCTASMQPVIAAEEYPEEEEITEEILSVDTEIIVIDGVEYTITTMVGTDPISSVVEDESGNVDYAQINLQTDTLSLNGTVICSSLDVIGDTPDNLNGNILSYRHFYLPPWATTSIGTILAVVAGACVYSGIGSVIALYAGSLLFKRVDFYIRYLKSYGTYPAYGNRYRYWYNLQITSSGGFNCNWDYNVCYMY